MAMTDLQTEYAGKQAQLFRLALKTGILTVLTLGFYRFWMKTRLRRYYWSSIRPGGIPLEYVGEPLEKLLGFLIAVVILAFYIGIVNLVLMFLSFSLLQGSFAAYALSFLGVVPVMFYARYRARRYILARTRWRGLRFGMMAGAWGYAWRACLHWTLTILTLGMLWPRMTFLLEKYRTDRTYFGSEVFVQGGRWQMLYPAFTPMLVAILGIASAVLAGYAERFGLAALFGTAGVLLGLYGWAYYKVESFRLLTGRKSLGGVGFIARPKTWRVIRIYAFGNLVTWALITVVLTSLFVAVAGLAIRHINLFELGASLPFWMTTVLAVVGYFAVFVSWGVLQHVFVTLPLARHYAETLELTGARHLTLIQQRDRDESTEAEGFAEALDLGAAI